MVIETSFLKIKYIGTTTFRYCEFLFLNCLFTFYHSSVRHIIYLTVIIIIINTFIGCFFLSFS